MNRRTFIKSAGAAAAGLVAAACAPRGTETASSNAQVLGKGRGIYPGRVVWAYNPDAARWDGKRGYWWQAENTDAALVAEMLSQSLRAQSGDGGGGDGAAWQALFAHFNAAHGRSGRGYQAGEKIAIKINVNYCKEHAYRGNGSFVNPAVVTALLKQLVGPAGVPAEAITVYDGIRFIPDAIYAACALPELSGVRFVDWGGGDGREQTVRDESVQVKWSQETGGSPTFLPTCLTAADYLINLSSLKGHNLAGVTLTAKNHFGSILADWKGEKTNMAPQGANIHGTVAAHDFDAGAEWKWPQRAMGTYCALVDLMAHPHLGGKTLLYLIDGLYPAPQQNAEVTAEGSRWQSAPFNGGWTASLFLSQDGVAIDSVGYDFLSSEPVILAQKDVLPAGHTAQNFLHEAAQAEHPASGAAYAAASLGVHDHWDSAETKRYARNRKQKEGVELVTLT